MYSELYFFFLGGGGGGFGMFGTLRLSGTGLGGGAGLDGGLGFSLLIVHLLFQN